MKIQTKGELAVLGAVSMLALGACSGGNDNEPSTMSAEEVAAAHVEETAEEAEGGEDGGADVEEALNGALKEADLVGEWLMLENNTKAKREGLYEPMEDGLQYIVMMQPDGRMQMTMEAAPDAADYVKDVVKDVKEEAESYESSSGTWSITGDDTVDLVRDNGNVMPGIVRDGVMTLGLGAESFTYQKVG